MPTDLVQHHAQSDLVAQMDYARAVASGSLLPQAYRGKPADIMIAVGLGQAMGLTPAESLYRIDVIQGKPTASGELIASNVRKAGHRLRVQVDESAMSVSATIFRSDDPEYPHTVTRDMEWAKGMGLHTKDNYKKQPLTMLQWRAVSAVARLACPEALYGVTYTPDEAIDSEPRQETPRVTAADFTAPKVNPAAHVGPTTNEDVQDAEVVPDEAPELMTDKTRKHMFALFGELNIGEDDQRAGIAHIIGHAIESRGDLTETEAQQVLTRLKVKKAEQDAGAESVEPDLFERGE